MNIIDQAKVCAVTGAGGFVGGRLKTCLGQAGLVARDWTRHPQTEDGVRFQLGEAVDVKLFTGTSALVHCAYDFSVRRWDDIVNVNVRGSEKLLRAARAAGVERIVCISSMSAFAGCRSLYGRAKLSIEETALSLGATVIRPGLVYGDRPGGVFGGLVRQVRNSTMLPLLGGNQLQYLVHSDDLAQLVSRCVLGELAPPTLPVTLAHETGWPIRRLLSAIGDALNRRVRFIPVPWRAAWFGLKTLELAGLPTPFRSDSLIGMIYQNPAPDFELAKSLNAHCRPFQITSTMLT